MKQSERGGPEITQLARTNTADQIARLLREKILTGALRPGTPLREVSVSRSLGVSRNTMREAMRILVHEGLVHHEVHRGASVAALAEEDIRSIFGARRTVESATLRFVDGREAEVAAALRPSIDSMAEAAERGDSLGVVEADMSFHGALVAFSASDRLTAFHAKLMAELRLGLLLADRARSDLQALQAEHEELLGALEQFDLEGFQRGLTAHLDAAEESLLSILQDHGSG